MMYGMQSDSNRFPRDGRDHSWKPLLLLGFLFLLGGVGNVMGSSHPGYEITKKGTLQAGDPIPAPKGKVILRIYGLSSGSSKDRPLKLDREVMEMMGTIRYTSKNRWYDNPITYEGVLGSRFLEILEVPEKATTMQMRALNDYVVEVPISDFRKWPVMLALKKNGAYMTVREKGPVWIVYPNHLYPELGKQPYTARWIWQLHEISIE